MRRLFCILLLFMAPPVLADHAIAMHGAPKYPADFHNFAYVNPDAPKGGTLRLGLTGAFDNLNPFALRGRAAFGANPSGGQLYLYDSLLARSQDEPFTLYGLIADDVSTPADRSSVTFHINPVAHFHDGAPITSADVRFSWDALRQHGRPNHRSYYNRVASVTNPDKQTITFTFKPNPDGRFDRELPLIIGLMPILAQHVWEKQDLTTPSMTALIGSGPYRVQSVDAGRSIRWERVPDYWARDLPSQRGLYNFDTIVVDYYRDDQVALQAFKAGAFDLRREPNPALWATAYQGSALEAGKYRLLTLPHQRVEPLRAYAFNLRRPMFQDKVLREVIHDSLDDNWINRVLFYGAFKRTHSTFPNSPLAATGLPDAAEMRLLEPWRKELPPELFTTLLPRPTLNSTTAHHQLSKRLQEAGYQLRDGQLYNSAGKPTAFTLLLNDPSEEKTAAQLARTLRQLGMAVQVQRLDSAQYQVRQNDFDYDMILVRWVNSLSPGNEQAVYWGSAAADQPGSRNYAGLRSPVIDALIAALTAAPDRAGLEAAAHALDRVLVWQFPAVPLFHQGADNLAIAARLAYPATMPSNGYVLESWWEASSKP
ncbi:MAG: ABC transporter substrate-binding protein [Alphaproteobacteria bacterium]|nr:ABC transporter substrate-binding protein [Alphaproteobacteria bacterium]